MQTSAHSRQTPLGAKKANAWQPLNAAQQQLMVSADACATPAYTHTPMAPEIPEYAPDQRYFTHGLRRRLSVVSAPDSSQDVYVMRFNECASVKLKINFYCLGSSVDVSTELTADQCRDLAARLLDAAYDIEVVARVDEVAA